MKFGLFYLPTYLPTLRDAQTHYRGIIEQVEFADQIGDFGSLPQEEIMRSLKVFADKVLPHVRDC
jgi:hypothetical protein